MPRRKVRKSVKGSKPSVHLSAKRRTIAAIVFVVVSVAVSAILVERAGVRSEAQRPLHPNGLDAANPTKEMVMAGRVVASEEAATAISFTDVAATHPYYSDIINIAARGVTLGCPAPQYCPDSNVTREQMAAFIMRSLGEFNPPTPPSQHFADVPPSNIFYNFIDRMWVLGITYGCGVDQQGQPIYCPSASVTHGQMAAFMERALKNPSPTPPSQASFCDVPSSYLFYALIEDYANVRRIWPGCNRTGSCANIPDPNCNNNPGRCFCPETPVLRKEMAHILVRAFDFY